MQAVSVATSIMESLRKLLAPLTTLAKFEWKKIDGIKLKTAVSHLGQGAIDAFRLTGDAFKPAIDVIGGVDDIAIDKLVAAHTDAVNNTVKWVHTEIDHLLSGGSAAGLEKDVDVFLQNIEDNVIQRLAA